MSFGQAGATALKAPTGSLPPGIGLVGAFLMLAPLFVRAATSFSPLPGFDQDPLSTYEPLAGLGPTGSIALDACSLLGAAVLAVHLRREMRAPRLAVLMAAGACSLIAAALLAPAFPHDQRVLASWLSAWAAAAVLAAFPHAPTRRLVLASVLSFAALLFVKSLVQTFIEHPAAVEAFRHSREQIFAARGWTPDSPMARAYERRLMQNDASAWFGLSNVLASISAAMTVVGAACVVGLVRARSGMAQDSATRPRAGALAAGVAFVAASCITLALTQSKGGFAACAVGLVAACAMGWASKLSRREGSASVRRLLPLLGPAAIFAPILGVLLRLRLGDQLAERSLLFRGFYFEGAVAIFREFFWLPLGPESFQAVFTRLKPPLCPEDVSSPHSILFDYAATLGGPLSASLIAGLLVLAFRAAGSVLGSPGEGSAVARTRIAPENARAPHAANADAGKRERQTLWLVAAFVTIGATALERPLMTPENALVRVLGLLAWGVLAQGLFAALNTLVDDGATSDSPQNARHSGSAFRVGLAGAAVSLLAHAQIEVTFSFPQSAGLAMVLLGCAAGYRKHAGDGQRSAGTASAASLLPARAVAWMLILGAATLAACGVRSWRWESALRDASRSATPAGLASASVASFVERSRAHTPDANDRVLLEQLLREAEIEAGSPATPLPTSLRSTIHASGAAGNANGAPTDLDLRMARLTWTCATNAERHLARAHDRLPSDWRTARALAEVRMRLAQTESIFGPGTRDGGSTSNPDWRESAIAALEEAEAQTDPARVSPALVRAIGVAHRQAADLASGMMGSGLPADTALVDKHRQAALDTFIRLRRFDPFNPSVPAEAAFLAERLGRVELARGSARTALDLDKLCFLDPVARGLSDLQRARLEALAGGGPVAPPGSGPNAPPSPSPSGVAP